MSYDFKEFVERMEKLEGISSKIEKTQILIDILKNTPKENFEYVLLFLMGKIYPEHIEKELGISQNLLMKAMSKAYGHGIEEIESMWKEKGDLGKIAEELCGKRKQSALLLSSLTLKEVFNVLRQAADIEGEGSIDKKVSLISGLLIKAKPKESKYLVRFILGDMRIGVAEGLIRDAIIGACFSQFYWVDIFTSQQSITEDIILRYWKNKVFLISKEAELSHPLLILIKKIAKEVKEMPEREVERISSFHYSKLKADIVITSSSELGNRLRQYYVELVDEAYALINDISQIALIAYEDGEEGLKKVKPVIFRPIKVMLAQKVNTIIEAFNVVGKPAAFEYKFDGFRAQIHKSKDKIAIFTRRLENVTKQFPDIVSYIKEHINAENCIIEGEVIGYDKHTKEWLPFQKLSQRIKRKYEIEKIKEEIPAMIHLFDVVYVNNELVIKKPFKERRKILENIVKEEDFKVMLAKQIITEDAKEAEKFYQEALNKGNEGIMAKNLNAPYKPGLRVGNMLKIKPTLETLDLVIVGAEWGEGKRAGYLSSYDLACYDPDTGEFLTIGKLGTGIKEKSEEGISFEELTEMLKPHIIREEGKHVVISPKIVVEVSYEEIQKSPHYSSGFALRFPRLVRVRDDKSPEEADTLERVYQIYEMQRGRGVRG